jgi:hypothetical protein
VLLTIHPLLEQKSRNSRVIPLFPPLWAFGSVTRYLYLYVVYMGLVRQNERKRAREGDRKKERKKRKKERKEREV